MAEHLFGRDSTTYLYQDLRVASTVAHIHTRLDPHPGQDEKNASLIIEGCSLGSSFGLHFVFEIVRYLAEL